MRTNRIPFLILLWLFCACFGMAAWLDPRSQRMQIDRSENIASTLLGDSRRMFANHFFVKADDYFHSGFYPTVFDDQESFQTPHMAEDAGAMEGKNKGEETAFMGKPRDVIDEFSRHFMPYTHTHLDEGGPTGDLGESGTGAVREILPWLQISAELDPNRIETYMVTAYWLRRRMGKIDEAERFLREGLQANPGNPALLFELGRVFHEDKKDANRARNLWEYGVRKLDEQKVAKTEQDDFIMFQLTLHLARLEEAQGNLPASIKWLERVKGLSHDSEKIERQISELREKLPKGDTRGVNGPPVVFNH